MEVDPALSGEVLEFGEFRLLPGRRALLYRGAPVGLGARALDILTVLARRAGEVVSKGELFALAWPEVLVSDGTLRVQVAGLRKALGDDGNGSRYIANIPGRGYCLTAPVRRAVAAPAAMPTLDNLPPLLTQMVGRDEVVERLIDSVPKKRLTTIVGAGGMGKTTVALAVANALRPTYPDGVLLVDLATLTDPSLVASSLALVLGLSAHTDEPMRDVLKALKTKKILLLFDNCEHVLVEIANVALAIIAGAEEVTILSTSREAIRVRGEHIQPLGALDSPPPQLGLEPVNPRIYPAFEMFVNCVARRIGAFEPSAADVTLISEICRRLDGIALAIELAAGQVPALGLAGVASNLDDRFRYLTHGDRTALPHQQTLLATYDWSYDYLPTPCQTALRQLAVFAGQFSLSDASMVLEGGDERRTAYQQLTSLVAASMITSTESGGTTYFSLLETTRSYGLEKLADAGERDSVFLLHAKFVLARVRAAESALLIASGATLRPELLGLLNEIRTSLDWCLSSGGDPSIGLHITASSIPLWLHLSLREECRRRVVAAIALLDVGTSADPATATRLRAALAMTHRYNGRLDSRRLWSDALIAAEKAADLEGRVLALRGEMTAMLSNGDLAGAAVLQPDLARAADDAGRDHLRARATQMQAALHFWSGDFKRSTGILKQLVSANCYDNSGDKLELIDERFADLVLLSKCQWMLGLVDDAISTCAECCESASRARHKISLAYSLSYAGCRLAILTGDFALAEQRLNALSEQASLDPGGQWGLMKQCWEGVLRNRQGDAESAMSLLGPALKVIPTGSFALHQTRFLGEYALARARSGDAVEGARLVRAALATCARSGERWFLSELLRIKGEITLLTGCAGSVSAAREDFESALELGRQQHALSSQLRATTSIAKIARGQDEAALAVDSLGRVYDRFTQGFSTVDLQEAQRVLGGPWRRTSVPQVI